MATHIFLTILYKVIGLSRKIQHYFYIGRGKNSYKFNYYWPIIYMLESALFSKHIAPL